MSTPGPTAAEDKLTEEGRSKGLIVQHPRWGYRTVEEPSGLFQPPNFNITACQELRDRYDIQSHDVVVTTFPKCGTTWMQQIVLLLLQGSNKVVNPMVDAKWFEWTASAAYNTENRNTDIPSLSVDDMLALPPPPEEESGLRAWKTHAPIRAVPWKGGLQQAEKVGAKIIIVCRNPKDAAISKYHHARRVPMLEFNGELEDFLPLYLAEKVVYNSFWDWHRDWWNAKEENPDTILWLHFEDMKKDLKKEITRIAEFLKLERTEEELEKVTERCTFKSMKSESDKRSNVAAKKSHFRSGKSGGWVNVMSQDIVDAFDKRTQKMYDECLLRFYDE